MINVEPGGQYSGIGGDIGEAVIWTYQSYFDHSRDPKHALWTLRYQNTRLSVLLTVCTCKPVCQYKQNTHTLIDFGKLWTGCQSVTLLTYRDKKTIKLTFIPRGNFELPVKPTCMSFGLLEEAGENVQTPHKKASANQGSNPEPFCC